MANRHINTALPITTAGKKRQMVWISKLQQPATVLSKAEKPRSYIVLAGKERLYTQSEHSVPADETKGVQSDTSKVELEFSARVPQTASPKR